MPAPHIKAAETGPGVYRFLVGDAILACRQELHDDDRFAACVEWCLSVAQPTILANRTWWNKAMQTALLDEAGKPLVDDAGRWLRPGIEIPKASQHKRIAALMVLLRQEGTFGRQPEDTEDAAPFLNTVLSQRGGAKGDPHDDDEDPEDHQDDD